MRTNNRFLWKLAHVEEFEEGPEHRTAVYMDVHEDPSTGPTYKLPTGTEFPKNSNYRWLLAALMAVILWSTMPVISLYTNNIPYLLRMAWALLFSSIGYISYWLYKYRGNLFAKVRPSWGYCLLSTLGMFGANVTFLLALKGGASIEAYMLINLWPVMAKAMSVVLGYGKLHRMQYIGSLLGISGVLLISLPDLLIPGRSLPWASIGFALLNCFIWSLYSLMLASWKDVPSDWVGVPVLLMCIISFLLHQLLEHAASPNAGELTALALLGLGPWGAAYALWSFAMKHGEAKVVVNYGYLVPVLGILWLLALGYTTFSMSLVCALFLVLIGSAVASRSKRTG